MATRFAVANGNWNTGATWDNGSVPVAGDTVYPNGFTVTIDTDINVASLNNNIPPVYIPNIATPAMTSNTQPTGNVISSNNSGTAYYIFDQNSSTSWSSGVNNTGWIGYTFSSAKTIKRYYIRIISINNNPKTWTLEGSNDGFATAGTVVDTVASYTTNANYLSSIINTSNLAFTSYRINVTVTQGALPVIIGELELTESTNASPVYGTASSGTFTVSNTLSGTRNITFSGAGIMSANGIVGNVLNLDNTLTNTVNINKTSGAYIINPLFANIDTSINPPAAININNNGIVNINGDIYGTITNSSPAANGLIRVVSNSTITVNGNLYPIAGRSNVVSYLFNFLSTSTNSTLTINGDVIGGNLYSNTYALFIQSVNTVNITGNLTSNSGYCYYSSVASFLNLTGSANLTNVNSVPCVVMISTTSLLTMNGAIINKGSVMAVSVQKMRYVSTATPYWIFQTTGASDMTLAYGNPVTGPYPAEADVRYNTAYGASPTRYGTLRVPLPQYVSQGVLTDNTTGTAYLSATDVWNVLTSNITTAGSVGKLISDNLNATVSSRASQTSVDTANTNINNLPANTTTEVWNKATTGITTSGSIGERLKNASTVQTNGDQLAAYIV